MRQEYGIYCSKNGGAHLHYVSALAPNAARHARMAGFLALAIHTERASGIRLKSNWLANSDGKRARIETIDDSARHQHEVIE
jgi:hypothetical protein